MPLNPLNHHYAMENSASVYDEEAMTALELAGRTTAKVNETVEAFNTLEADTDKHLKDQDEDIVQKFKIMTEVTIPETVKADVLAHIHNGDFDQAINTYLNYLNERVDNLLGQVTTGTTSMDAEVIDGRTRYNGEVSDNLGNAIRYQYGDLLDRLGTPAIEWVDGYYINSNGGEYALTFTSVTNFIPVIPGIKYKVKTHINENMHIAYYNSAKGFISSFDDDKNALTVYNLEIPADCYYVRFTCYTEDKTKAELMATNTLSAIQWLYDTLVERTTVELKSTSIINGVYVSATRAQPYTLETFDTLVYDVSKLNGFTLTLETAFVDAGEGHFLNAYGEFISGIESLSVEVPVGAVTMRISTCIARKPTEEVKVYYSTNQNIDEEIGEKVNYVLGMGNTLCIGDSLTSGACYSDSRFNGASIDQNYPRYLAKIIQADVVNAGKSGYSASDWWLKVAPEYKDRYEKFDTFIIWLGTNNGLTDTLDEDVNAFDSYDDFANTETGYYCKIISQIKDMNPDAFIVLCNVFATKGNRETTNNVISQIATKYGCPVVNMTMLGTANHPELHGGVTNVHFGKAGNIYLANHIQDTINEYFNKNPLALEFGLTSRTN